MKNFATFTGKHLCWSLLKLYQKETLPQAFSCKYRAILKKTYFEEDLCMAAFNYGNLAMFFRENFSEQGKLASLSKSKNNILSRTIQLVSGDQLLSLLLTLYLLLAQFRVLIDML